MSGGRDQVKATPEVITQLGKDVEKQVAPLMEQAGDIPPELPEVEDALYTSLHPSFATVYSVAVEYCAQQVAGNLESFAEMVSKLQTCGDNWATCEATNTFPTGE